jgi:hypothetical protein
LRCLEGRLWVGERTFAGTRGNGEVAPIPVARETTIEPQGSTQFTHRRIVRRQSPVDLERTFTAASKDDGQQGGHVF